MKERVMFQTNVPVTVALAYPDGVEVEGRYGDQVMYTLADERVMYVPPIVRDKIRDLGIRQGQTITICRAERRDGNRRFLEWLVEHQAVTSEAIGAQATTNDAPRLNGTLPERPQPVPNGTARQPQGPAAALRSALAVSIDAAIAAEQYACSKGLSVRFGSEDLRAMALSLFIQHARDGGLR